MARCYRKLDRKLLNSRPCARGGDASMASAPLDRRVVVGAMLAGGVAPALADPLCASSSLEGSIGGAVALHAALLGR
ncbi:MAG: hypothetical protein BGO98_24675 [Myxococcales bacterium 68-20]|nr:MAG: hypothetical protein BGO98_24675 [Myxococcales bacterium 68-20]